MAGFLHSSYRAIDRVHEVELTYPSQRGDASHSSPLIYLLFQLGLLSLKYLKVQLSARIQDG